MISNPNKGQRVQVWYRAGMRDWMPLHGKIGEVEIVCKARKARNHGVLIDGKVYAVPCGNLRNPEESK